MKLSIEKILTFYIAITPLFWFWFIPAGFMIPFKLMLLTFIIFFLIVVKKRKINKEYLFFLAFISIVAIPSILRTSFITWSFKYVLYLLIILTVSAFYNFFIDKKITEIINFIKAPALIVSGICLITVINYFTGFPDWREEVANIRYAHYLYQTGFSASRTSWTPAISFFFIANLYFFFNESLKKRKILFFVAAVVILMSQVLAGGRSGMLISFAAIAYYVFFKINFKILLLIFLILLLIIIPQFDKILELARLEHIDFTSFETLNRFSTGRLIQWVWGVDKFFENYNFVLGAGFDLEDSVYLSQKYGEVEIHNFWINIAVRGGIGMFLFYIIFSFYYVRKSYLLYRKDKRAEMFMLFIVCGLVGTLFEPALILGKVQTTIIWWISIAAIDVIAAKNKGIKPHETIK